jgi:hypothetical protein
MENQLIRLPDFLILTIKEKKWRYRVAGGLMIKEQKM